MILEGCDLYQNYLQHYKYIDKYRGKNGKWIYRYSKKSGQMTPGQHTRNRHFGDDSINLNRTGLKLQTKHLKNKAVKGYVETKYKIKKANRNFNAWKKRSKVDDAVRAYVDARFTHKSLHNRINKLGSRALTKLESKSLKKQHEGRRKLKGGAGQYQSYLERRNKIQNARKNRRIKK